MLTNGNSPSFAVPPIVWALVGGAATTALYFLLVSKASPSDASSQAPPPQTPPSGPKSISDVQARFDQIREAYNAGTKPPGETLTELHALEDEATRLQVVTKSDPAATIELLARMLTFRKAVEEDTRAV